MRVPRFWLGRCLTIATVAGLWLAACQNPDAFYRNSSKGSGQGGSSGSGPGAGGATMGAGGFIGLGGRGGSMTSGAGGLIVMNNGGAPGRGGSTGDAGMDAAPPPCTTCAVKVHYTCRDAGTNQASFTVLVENGKATSVPLSMVTVRYWFTNDPPATAQQAECDYAMLTCGDITLTTGGSGAMSYAEIGFPAAAGMLSGFQDTGDIQIRVHDNPYGPAFDQTNDYSYDCSMMGTSVLNMKMTAYIGGMLVWGTEPM
jgi:hypothetical protein